MPFGGVVAASSVGVSSMSSPLLPSVLPAVPSLPLSSTLIVLSFAAAAASASALSLALLFAISKILSISPLKVKVSSLALRGWVRALRSDSW